MLPKFVGMALGPAPNPASRSLSEFTSKVCTKVLPVEFRLAESKMLPCMKLLGCVALTMLPKFDGMALGPAPKPASKSATEFASKVWRKVLPVELRLAVTKMLPWRKLLGCVALTMLPKFEGMALGPAPKLASRSLSEFASKDWRNVLPVELRLAE